MVKKHANALIPVERIERAILLIRGHKVMLDRDLAELYGVKAIALGPAGQPQRSPISPGLHVSTEPGGGRSVGITKCDTFKPCRLGDAEGQTVLSARVARSAGHLRWA